MTNEVREGSTTYYSLLYAEPDARRRAAKTLRLIHTISTTLFDVTEQQVAEKKIHWWHEEIARMATKQAKHPDCAAVQPFLHDRYSLNACLAILSAAASERYTPIATEQDMHEHLSMDYGARLTLVSKALSPLDDAANDASMTASTSDWSTLAVGLGQWHRLSTLGLRLKQGYGVFSDEKYQQYKLSPENLLSRTDGTDTESIRDAVSKLLLDAISKASAAMEGARNTEQNPLYRNGNYHLPIAQFFHLRSAQLGLWKNKKPDLTSESVSLTPLKKYLLTYRCRRQFKRKVSASSLLFQHAHGHAKQISSSAVAASSTLQIMMNSNAHQVLTPELLNFSLAANSLTDRVVVISGATGGLGGAISLACAAAGATVVLLAKELNKLEAQYDALAALTNAAQPAMITLDLAQTPESGYQQLTQTLKTEFGKVDALIHTAADLSAPGPLANISQADWSRIMSVNLTSARLLTNACIPLLAESDNASVTFTHDDKTGAYWGAYGVSKTALLQLAHILFDETENQRHADGSPKLAVNAINPGPMRTALRRKAFPGELESETSTPDTRIGPFLALVCRNDRLLNGKLLSPS